MVYLRDLIRRAQEDMDRYKHPDTSEVEAKLDAILKAGKLGGIAGDELTGLYFYNGVLRITTSYSVRNCEMTGRYEIPEYVIDAEDPEAAVKLWSKNQSIAKAKHELEKAEQQVSRCKAALAALRGDKP